MSMDPSELVAAFERFLDREGREPRDRTLEGIYIDGYASFVSLVSTMRAFDRLGPDEERRIEDIVSEVEYRVNAYFERLARAHTDRARPPL